MEDIKLLTQEKKEFISFMISSGVLKFGEFITKSGRNTPYFINTGNYKTGSQFHLLGKFYAKILKESCCKFDALFGPAYKGISLVTCCANALYCDYGIDKPFFFNRKEVKDHGEGGNLVGYMPHDGDRIVIIEDVITAGTAVRESMPILQSCGRIKCEDMFISVNRCEIGQNASKTAITEVKEQFGINVHSIVNVKDIRNYLKANGEYEKYITKMDGYIDKYCIID